MRTLPIRLAAALVARWAGGNRRSRHYFPRALALSGQPSSLIGTSQGRCSWGAKGSLAESHPGRVGAPSVSSPLAWSCLGPGTAFAASAVARGLPAGRIGAQGDKTAQWAVATKPFPGQAGACANRPQRRTTPTKPQRCLCLSATSPLRTDSVR